MRLVEVEPSVSAAAARLAVRHLLAGADAIHLASALSMSGPTDVLVVWDRRLRDGALAEGLTVAPGAGQIPHPSG